MTNELKFLDHNLHLNEDFHELQNLDRCEPILQNINIRTNGKINAKKMNAYPVID